MTANETVQMLRHIQSATHHLQEAVEIMNETAEFKALLRNLKKDAEAQAPKDVKELPVQDGSKQ